MRFILASDLHGGTARYNQPVAGPLGSSRMVEFEGVLATLADAVGEHDASAVMIGGDLFDHRHPTPTMLRVWSEFCGRMIGMGRRVLMVPGNHDGAAAIGNELTHTHGWMAALQLAGVRVYTRPKFEVFDDFTLVAMPYPHRRALDDGLDGVLPEERVIAAGREMENLIRSYGEEAVRRTSGQHNPIIFLGHLTVLGSRTASERLMRMEWDIAVAPEAFEAFDFVALGHIHKMQEVGNRYDEVRHPVTHDRQARIWYAGSPVYLDFSEAKQPKGFLLVNIDRAGGSVIPLRSNPREMARIRLEYVPELASVALTGLEVTKGKIVELTITGPRPPEAWVENVERSMRAAGVHVLKTKVQPDDMLAIPSTEEDHPDLTDKTVALARYLRERRLPDEPYLSAGRSLIEG